jgi:collagen type I alpha
MERSPIACFVAGTRIATESGEIAVQALRVGDRVRAVLSGRWETVEWIGHRVIDCTRHPQQRQVWPIRVSAHAFGPCKPGRDLWLSPHHAVYVNDVLIPVGLLINGSTVRQVQLPAIDYWHVELPRHDVILAEGMPAESYLDKGDRTDFLGAGPLATLFPVFGGLRAEGEGCAPFITEGPEFDAARALVAERAALGARVG